MQIAALVDNLGPSQSSFYLINEFNKAALIPDACVSVFFLRPTVPVIPTMFSCKSVSFLSAYHGVAIATTLKDADILLKGNNNSDKYLYLWDMEWLTYPQNFEGVTKILLDDRIKIIARSESHCKLINNYCNKHPIGIVDNWNIGQLMNLILPEVANV
jgi:hypothetical protein